MTDLTTAQRLATYRAELLEAGFDASTTAWYVGDAAPTDLDDVILQDDLDDDSPPVASVRVRIVPQNLEAEAERLVVQLRERLAWHAAASRQRFAEGGVIQCGSTEAPPRPQTASSVVDEQVDRGDWRDIGPATDTVEP